MTALPPRPPACPTRSDLTSAEVAAYFEQLSAHLAELELWRTDLRNDPSGPCRRAPDHGGRCRNDAGTTWDGACDAHRHPRQLGAGRAGAVDR